MNVKIWLFFLTFLVLGLISWVAVLQSTKTKIAFVRTGYIVEKYKGVEEAKKIMDSKLENWEANVDTLELNYNRSLDKYNSQFNKLPLKEREELKAMLERQYESLGSYVTAIEKKAIDENQKMMEGIIAQINIFIKKYSEENGYDLVFGATMNGNILFGEDAVDITDEVLEQMNAQYQGK